MSSLSANCETKYCSRCAQVVAIGEFWPNARGKQGRAPYCKPCARAYQRERYRAKVGPKRPYRKNVDSYSDDYKWKIAILRRYNLTCERYQEMYDEQLGLCAICLNTAEARRADKKRLAVDHDRACCPGNTSCGQCIRGLLCIPCNVSLGGFQDNPEWLRRAASYSERKPNG